MVIKLNGEKLSAGKFWDGAALAVIIFSILYFGWRALKYFCN